MLNRIIFSTYIIHQISFELATSVGDQNPLLIALGVILSAREISILYHVSDFTTSVGDKNQSTGSNGSIDSRRDIQRVR